MSSRSEEIRGRLASIRARIDDAAARSGRDAREIAVLGVVKAQPLERVIAAVDAGLTDLGENYVQQWHARAPALEGRDVRWHFIGRLQRSKIRHVAGRVALVHSLDTTRSGEVLARRCAGQGATQDVLLQVDIASESSKAGLAPTDLPAAYDTLAALDGIRVRGLMILPPPATEPEDNRRWFAAARTALEDLRARSGAPGLDQLSMGMSGDFEIAVEEGSTLVRVGTALFGPRPPA